MVVLDPADYHVAWIAPLWIEQVAAIQMLDDLHEGSFPHTEGRKYLVTAGRIGMSNVIIATLEGEYGNVTAADLASEIRNRFPKIQLSLLVGIAAGLPLLPDRDIRLGDVLVAVPSQHDAGIVAYNIGKTTSDGFYELQTLAQADGLVRSTITMVRGEWRGPILRPGSGQRIKFLSHYDKIKNVEHGVTVRGYPKDFAYPGQEEDKGPEVPIALPESAGNTAATRHTDTAGAGDTMATGSQDKSGHDSGQRPTRDERTCVWYGSIGTGDELIKHASRSAELRAKYDIIGLEMEAYGTMTGLRAGVIRGVCDYANERKIKVWQPYAAAVAAAYAKTVITRAGDMNPDRNGKGVVRDATTDPQCFHLAVQTKEERRAIFMVNFDRNSKTLVPRAGIYDSISNFFESSNRVALWGLGGVGKSQIAIEFLYRTADKDSDRSIYWVSAASASHFLDSLRDIAREIPKESLDSIKELHTSTRGDSNSPDIPQIVKHWLSSSKSGPWLIILDNADTYEIFSKTGSQKHSYIQYIPRSNNGWVLMTTRSRGIGEQFMDKDSALLHVQAMTLDEAVELFHNSLPNDETPVTQVEELAKMLDFLPLAIKQAIAYIRYYKPMMSIGKYLLKFKTDEKILLREFSDTVRDPDGLSNAVIVTWQINFDQISTLSHTTTEVIACLAVLDREAIPTFLLTEMLGEQDLAEDIGLLVQYSFIVAAASPLEEPNETIWSVHRLVHQTMQIWSRSKQVLKQWEGKALVLLGDAFNRAVNTSMWWKARLLLPHVRLALSYPAASDAASSTLRRLISEFERPTWLSMSRERSESERIQATQHAIAGTCDWLFNHEWFIDWLHGQSRLLFLLGGPGSGKTTLCSRIVKYLSERRDRGDKVRVLYSYATSGSTNRCLDVAMTLLSQLCADMDNLPDDLRFRLAAISAAQGHPHAESITSALELALRRTSETVFIVIDGLDELPDLERKLCLDFIVSLQSDNSAPGTRIIVASRPMLDVYHFAARFVMINISNQNSPDINLLIADGINQLNLPDQMDDFKARLTAYLAANADGSILWVNIALRYIAEGVAMGFSEAELLHQLPAYLKTRFRLILESIPVERRSQAMDILAWPTFTFRPLSRQEFVEAVELNGSDNSFGLRLAVTNARADQISKLLHGMVVIRQDQVHLVHQTVREFLLHSHSMALDPRHSHTQILSTCLDTLLEDPDVKRPALFNYAAEFWMTHFEELQHESLPASIGQAWDKLFDVDHPQYFLRWLRHYDPLNPLAGEQPEKRLEDFPCQKEYMNLVVHSK